MQAASHVVPSSSRVLAADSYHLEANKYVPILEPVSTNFLTEDAMFLVQEGQHRLAKASAEYLMLAAQSLDW